MCGRYSFTDPHEATLLLAQLGRAVDMPPPRFNVAPTQQVPAVIWEPGQSAPDFKLLRWGLIPYWATDESIGNRLINARCETAAAKPAFRDAFRHRRCLVLSDGFYEWQKNGKARQPYYIRMRDGSTFAYAGLWDRWTSPHGQLIESCTILTTDSNEVIQPLHDRMPVIIDRADYFRWLDPQQTDPAALKPLLRSFPAERMVCHPVASLVNSPLNETPGCVEPINLEEETLF